MHRWNTMWQRQVCGIPKEMCVCAGVCGRCEGGRQGRGQVVRSRGKVRVQARRQANRAVRVRRYVRRCVKGGGEWDALSAREGSRWGTQW